MSVRLGRFIERNPVRLSERLWVPVMHFCARPIDCKVHCSVGRRLGSYRLISVQPLIGLVNHQFILYRLFSVGIG